MTRVHGRSASNLSPEQKRAVTFLIAFLESWDSVVLPTVPELDQLVQKENVSVVDGIITSKKLPSGETWFWNQTHSSHSVTIPAPDNLLYEVLFRKLLCRKKKKHPDATDLPRHKLWLYNITLSLDRVISVIWCEKGIIPATDSDVNIADAFLELQILNHLTPKP